MDLLRLKKALDEAVAAHPYLKTTLYMDENGDIWQKGNGAAPFTAEINDRLCREELVRPYRLLGDWLFRTELFDTEEGKYLFLEFHYIISDGTSCGMFLCDHPRLGSALFIIANAVNLVLDVLFIRVFQMGMAGCALSTVTGYRAGMATVFIYFRSRHRMLHLRKEICANIIRCGYLDGRKNYMDVSFTVQDGAYILRVRDDGIPFNPLEYRVREEGPAVGGIALIRKMMSGFQYMQVLNMNNTVIMLEMDRQ